MKILHYQVFMKILKNFWFSTYILHADEDGRMKSRDEYSIKIIRESGLFDEEYYLTAYSDIKISNIDPVVHYVKQGVYEGRKPNKQFNTVFYEENCIDVDFNFINPFVHYILQGMNENRQIERLDQNSLDNSDLHSFLFSQNHKKSEKFVDFKINKLVETDIKLIAFYLPQFHPIPQNDANWGRGFTEWTNVSKALPQFHGHYQPKLPGELGFYDLRLKEVQARQIELARNYGLHGFCYHYYWFDGEKIMDTPLQQVLDNLDLDFPFCINWANENWTKKWDGSDNDIIFEQKHTDEDDLAFLETIKPILTDKRYIRIDGKPLLMIYRPNLFPDIKATVAKWGDYALKIGIGELYLVMSHSFEHMNPRSFGFDAASEFAPNSFNVKNISDNYIFFKKNYRGSLYDYKSAVNYSISYQKPNYVKFRSICPGWDNEARKPSRGSTFVNTTPNTYAKWLEYLLYFTNRNMEKEEKIIFINAWNEWAEGAYLEPDRRYGYAYLEETYKEISKFSNNRLSLIASTQKNIKMHDTAVILHLYHIDLWGEIKNNLNKLHDKFDLYININNKSNDDFFFQILDEYPSATLFSYENRGRDILPFIQMLEYIIPLDYKYVCKIHTKKSTHRQDGDIWRKHLVASILSSVKRIEQAKELIDNGAGIVIAKGNIFSYEEWKGSNEHMINELVKKLNIKLDSNFLFPAGSIFWFSPYVFRKITDLIDVSEFEFEEGQVDGTIAHAVERIFGLMCFIEKKDIKEI